MLFVILLGCDAVTCIAVLSSEHVHIAAGGSVDIQGVCKSTVVRGEDDFPIGVLRVTDCHDTVVYALAPLQYVKIAACSDCQVLLLVALKLGNAPFKGLTAFWAYPPSCCMVRTQCFRVKGRMADTEPARCCWLAVSRIP